MWLSGLDPSVEMSPVISPFPTMFSKDALLMVVKPCIQ